MNLKTTHKGYAENKYRNSDASIYPYRSEASESYNNGSEKADTKKEWNK